jgi:hypothetical protein
MAVFVRFLGTFSVCYFFRTTCTWPVLIHMLVLRDYSSSENEYNFELFIYISNEVQIYTVYLETALHVSGGTSTHLQGSIQLYLQHLVLVTP